MANEMMMVPEDILQELHWTMYLKYGPQWQEKMTDKEYHNYVKERMNEKFSALEALKKRYNNPDE